jgi:hypothetical protein
LPTEITRLFDAAKRSVLYVELLPEIGLTVDKSVSTTRRLWSLARRLRPHPAQDAATMPSFRDTLDHLVQASTLYRDTPTEAVQVRLAAEHLGIVVADAVQQAVGRVLAAVLDLEKRPVRSSYRTVPTKAEMRRRHDEIAHCLELGRLMKGKIEPGDWIEAGGHFEDAFEKSFALLVTLREAPLRTWPAIFGTLTILGGFLGVLLAERIFS